MMRKRILILLFAICMTCGICLWNIPEANAAGKTISAADIVSVAGSLTGKYPYVWGGKSPEAGGFDCSGLVYYVYHTRLGHAVTYEQIWSRSIGTRITDKGKLQVGDLVYGTTSGGGHIGIYIGNNTMIHAGSSNGVCKTSINGSWFDFKYGIRLPDVTQGTSESSDIRNETIQELPKTTSITDGEWRVSIPAGYKLLLYSDEVSTTSATYVSARSDTYQIVCSKKAILSNGSIRYYAGFNTSDHYWYYWFTYGNGMTLEESSAAKTHTVNFNANGGSVSTTNKLVEAGGTYGMLPVPVRDGYAFGGWYTSVSGGTKITASTIVNLPNDQTTLYAHWNSPTTIRFDPNGGELVFCSDGAQTYLWKSTSLPSATRAGYTFSGWYTAKSGGEKVSCIEPGNNFDWNTEYVLYAQWTTKYTTVYFDANGGNVSTEKQSFISEPGPLPTPTRSGYTFDGWYTERIGGTKITREQITSADDGCTFYAHWTQFRSMVVVTLDGMNGEVEEMAVAYGETYEDLPTPAKWGYVFDGWYTAANGGVRVMDGDPVMSDEDHRLYAHWTQALYTVMLDPNGGAIPVEIYTNQPPVLLHDPQEHIVGGGSGSYGALPTPVRDGYTFVGWYTAPSGGSLVTSSSSPVVQGNHTLYAHWN